MNRLVIIDGNAILHRAYHALPPLTSPDGTIVNAVYGFTSMLLRLITDLTPSHLAVAFDRPAPTFRKKMFTGYQAKRPKMDDELSTQIPLVHDVLTAFHIPIFELDGYEADDVIGTIVEKVTSEKQKVKSKKTNLSLVTCHVSHIDQVIIVTGDRDILQLVEDDRVLVYMPTKGLSEAKLYGEKDVIERLGVTPKQIPDFKALAGDQSDNYPGVAGIGPKTAITLLTEFKTIDNLYKQLEKGKHKTIGENVLEKLIKDKDSALLSHQLATITTDVPIPVNISPLKPEQLTSPNAIAALQTFGFTSLIKRITGHKTTDNEQGVKDKLKKNKKEEKPVDQQQLF